MSIANEQFQKGWVGSGSFDDYGEPFCCLYYHKNPQNILFLFHFQISSLPVSMGLSIFWKSV